MLRTPRRALQWRGIHLYRKLAPKTFEWTIQFVDGDLAEWIKRSASDQLGKSVPYGLSPDFFRVFSHLASRHLFRNTLLKWSHLDTKVTINYQKKVNKLKNWCAGNYMYVLTPMKPKVMNWSEVAFVLYVRVISFLICLVTILHFKLTLRTYSLAVNGNTCFPMRNDTRGRLSNREQSTMYCEQEKAHVQTATEHHTKQKPVKSGHKFSPWEKVWPTTTTTTTEIHALTCEEPGLIGFAPISWFNFSISSTGPTMREVPVSAMARQLPSQ